ncbi:MAG: hypothetical protein ACI311_01645 [Bacilli bacterium]
MLKKISYILTIIMIIIGISLCYDINQYSKIKINLIDLSQESDYLISKNGKIDNTLQDYFENSYNVKLICTDNCNPKYGDLLSYEIKKESNFMVIGFTTNEVILKKKVLIGN